MPGIRHDIDGWFDYSGFYDEMVAKFDNAHFVEVGCWFGRSGTYLLEKIAEDKKNIVVDFVDSWYGDLEVPYQQNVLEKNGEDFVYNSFVSNVNMVAPDYKGSIHRGDSTLSAALYENDSLDFVYLDANHSYEMVVSDIQAWLPKLKEGGVLGGHDYEQPGVKRAVQDILGNCQERAGHAWVYEKTK